MLVCKPSFFEFEGVAEFEPSGTVVVDPQNSQQIDRDYNVTACAMTPNGDE